MLLTILSFFLNEIGNKKVTQMLHKVVFYFKFLIF